MTADNDPMPMIRTLLKRLATEADSIGLDMGQAMIMPSQDGTGPDMLQAIFMIRPAAVVVQDEQAVADEKAVEEMFARTRTEELEEKKQTIISDVQGWLDE